MKRRQTRTRRAAATADPVADPFGERRGRRYRFSASLFGARFHFDSDSRALLDLARSACPPDSVGRARASARGDVSIGLRLHHARTLGRIKTPPAPVFSAAAGLVTTCIDQGNHAAVAPAQRAALVVVSPDMRRFPYHARYELVEFALYTLATRALGLVPLHAASVTDGKRGWLLLGASGAGKTTTAALCALAGMGLQSEDVVFYDPRCGQLHALPRYLHLHRAALALVDDPRVRRQLARAPVIERRGGARKREVDLASRSWCSTVASSHLQGVVLLVAGKEPALRLREQRLSPRQLLQQLRSTQPQGASHAGWREFLRHAQRLPAFELARTDDMAAALSRVVAAAATTPAAGQEPVAARSTNRRASTRAP